MDGINQIAFNAAKEMVIASLNGQDLRMTRESGEAVADFFEAIYERALKIAKEEEV